MWLQYDCTTADHRAFGAQRHGTLLLNITERSLSRVLSCVLFSVGLSFSADLYVSSFFPLWGFRSDSLSPHKWSVLGSERVELNREQINVWWCLSTRPELQSFKTLALSKELLDKSKKKTHYTSPFIRPVFCMCTYNTYLCFRDKFLTGRELNFFSSSCSC